jgi:hypothetical protein
MFRRIHEVGAEVIGPVEERAVPFTEIGDALISAGVVLAELRRLRVRKEAREALHAQLRLEEGVDIVAESLVLVEGGCGCAELRQQGLQVLVPKEEYLI